MVQDSNAINEEKCAIKLRYCTQREGKKKKTHKPKQRDKSRQSFAYEAAFQMCILYIYITPKRVVAGTYLFSNS